VPFSSVEKSVGYGDGGKVEWKGIGRRTAINYAPSFVKRVSTLKHCLYLVRGDLAGASPTKVAEPPKPKAPVKKQGDALADAASSGSDTSSNATVHPLLADEHVEPEEEVVYSSGPDIEESIEDLLPKSDDERL
jgi:hypothetical protein